MQEQIVSSYVRHKQQKTEVPNSTLPAVILIGLALTYVAVLQWGITLAIAATALVRYGIKFYLASKVETPAIVEEASTKPKRGYHKRLKVNHYQVKKQVIM